MAASTALPPFRRTSAPTSEATGWAETTIAESAVSPITWLGDSGTLQATTATAGNSRKMRFIIINVGKVKIKVLIQTLSLYRHESSKRKSGKIKSSGAGTHPPADR